MSQDSQPTAADQLLTEYESGKLSRRGFLAALSAVGVASSNAATSPPAVQVSSINHVTFFVKDIPKAAQFYKDLFGLEVLSQQTNGINLATGTDGQFLGFYGGTPETDLDVHHVCLGLKDFDVDELVKRLKTFGITAQIRMRDDTVPEIYFVDPFGIRIQLQHESYCGGNGLLGNQC